MRIPLILAVLTCSAGPVFACDKFITIDPDQQKADFNLLADDAADPIDRITAFSTLICSDQIAVRRKALQDGLIASPEIRSEALYRSLAATNTITIGLRDETGLTDAHYEYLRANPLLSHSVKFRDPAAACISIYYNDRCVGEYQFSVRGDRVDYRYNDNSGQFVLEGGVLTGHVSLTVDRQEMTFPAEIALN